MIPVEDLTKDFVDYLSDNLNAHVQDVATDSGEALEDIYEISLADRDVTNLPAYPVLQVVPTEHTLDVVSMGSYELAAQMVLVLATDKVNDSDATAKMLRYLEAIRRCLDQAEEDSFWVDGVDQRMVYIPTRGTGEVRAALYEVRIVTNVTGG